MMLRYAGYVNRPGSRVEQAVCHSSVNSVVLRGPRLTIARPSACDPPAAARFGVNERSARRWAHHIRRCRVAGHEPVAKTEHGRVANLGSPMSLPSSHSLTSSTPTEQTVDALLRDGQPDWEAIRFEVLCSRCGYNLRMLPQPRCPECGLQFDWRDVLDASAWRSKFLFEHHWRDRFVRSWLKSTWAGLRPFRFWRQVSIHDRVRPGPLWFLLLTSVLWFPITVHLLAWLGKLASETAIRGLVRPGPITPQWEWLDTARQVMSYLLVDFRRLKGDLQLMCVLLLALLAALALLCGLRQTLGRCRVRTVQIIRVFAYASTPMFISLGALFVASVVSATIIERAIPWALAPWMWLGILIPLLACPTVFLFAGLKRYLQLPRAALLAATAAVVGALFAVTTFLFLGAYIIG